MGSFLLDIPVVGNTDRIVAEQTIIERDLSLHLAQIESCSPDMSLITRKAFLPLEGTIRLITNSYPSKPVTHFYGTIVDRGLEFQVKDTLPGLRDKSTITKGELMKYSTE